MIQSLWYVHYIYDSKLLVAAILKAYAIYMYIYIVYQLALLKVWIQNKSSNIEYGLAAVNQCAVCLLQIFVRALFDYNPEDDDMIPCPQAGVSFRVGDVLRVSTVFIRHW